MGNCKCKSIRDITAQFNLSNRTLRYYEDMGLIESTKNGDGVMRYYDECNEKKLATIVTLREMDLSIKEIKEIVSGYNFDILKVRITNQIEKMRTDINTMMHTLGDTEALLYRLNDLSAEQKDKTDELLYSLYELYAKKKANTEVYPESTGGVMTPIALNIVEFLQQGRYDEVQPYFDIIMKRFSPTPRLKEVWEKMTEFLGEPLGIHEIFEKEKSDYTKVVITVDYGEIGLDVTFRFANNEIVGLWFGGRRIK
jgi:DNA-binding transcriptional MerR regulator